MHKLAIVHFNPIELYPPVLNWVKFLAEQDKFEIAVRIYTMKLGSGESFNETSPRIKISRHGIANEKKPLRRYWSYCKFYMSTILGLFAWRPDTVLYYETLSALPAILYKGLGKSSASLYIHYHEYHSNHDYETGIKLNRWQHQLETKIYKEAAWISQTNRERMDFFIADNRLADTANTRILPNYPPESWLHRDNQHKSEITPPVRIIYIGALSLDTMYTMEFANWVLRQNGEVIWDIYSTNSTDEAKAFIQSLDSTAIRFRGGVDYFSLPDVMANYDVGVILYKGVSHNHIYSVPNKLIEYLICGLDVWLSDKLTGSLPYVCTSSYPKVIALDLANMAAFDHKNAISRNGLPYKASGYFCERELAVLFEAILSDKQSLRKEPKAAL